MSGVVAIVGRPNVGKSTLFNRLIGERKSIVNDRPGVTRDRIYGMGEINGEEVHFIDTGGFEPRPEHKIFDQIRIQAEVAIAEADVLLFVVDRVSGITATDERTAAILRKMLPSSDENKLIVLVNKCDLPQHEQDAVEFWSLGFPNLLCVSAEHGQGMYELHEAITERLPKRSEEDEEEQTEDVQASFSEEIQSTWDIALENRENPQESDEHFEDSFIEGASEEESSSDEPEEIPFEMPNLEGTEFEGMTAEEFSKIFGEMEVQELSLDDAGLENVFPDEVEHEKFLEQAHNENWDDRNVPVADEIKIAVLGRPNIGKSTLVNQMIGSERHVVHDMPGTTMDAVDSLLEIDGRKYIFVDTAGIRRRSKIDDRLESFAVYRAIKTIEKCHIVLLMIDGVEGITNQDARLANLISERGRGCILLINRWDLVKQMPNRNVHVLRDEIEQSLPHLSWAPTLYISAMTAKGTHRILPTVHKVYQEFNKRISTSKVNNFLKEIVEHHPPPQKHHHRVRLNYITQPRVRPPTFVIWSNSPDGVKESYRRYLENRMRATFGFEGTPIRLYIRKKRRQWEERK